MFTLAGPAGPVGEALERLLGAAIHEIDMEQHSGEHPRIVARSMCPVGVGATTMDEAVELARAFEASREAFDLPVFLYAGRDPRSGSSSPTFGAASTRGSRRRSTSAAASRTSGRADASLGGRPGGARPFLIAYNINLGSPDRDLAVRIARRIRESGGGLPRLRANGFFIEELDRGCR